MNLKFKIIWTEEASFQFSLFYSTSLSISSFCVFAHIFCRAGICFKGRTEWLAVEIL